MQCLCTGYADFTARGLLGWLRRVNVSKEFFLRCCINNDEWEKFLEELRSRGRVEEREWRDGLPWGLIYDSELGCKIKVWYHCYGPSRDIEISGSYVINLQ